MGIKKFGKGALKVYAYTVVKEAHVKSRSGLDVSFIWMGANKEIYFKKFSNISFLHTLAHRHLVQRNQLPSLQNEIIIQVQSLGKNDQW